MGRLSSLLSNCRRRRRRRRCPSPPFLVPTPSQLRDVFFSDHFGRSVTILAPSRRTAACALRTLLFQLSRAHGTDAALCAASQWRYIDRTGVKHGPYPFATMIKWYVKNAFGHNDALPVQHAHLGCWLPLWFLPELKTLVRLQGAVEPEEASMEDWEAAVRQVNESRAGKGGGGGGEGVLLDFPELGDDTAAPMDYEVSIIPSDAAPGELLVCVSVLLVIYRLREWYRGSCVPLTWHHHQLSNHLPLSLPAPPPPPPPPPRPAPPRLREGVRSCGHKRPPEPSHLPRTRVFAAVRGRTPAGSAVPGALERAK